MVTDVQIKTRADHRHHAVDALVVAHTERKYIQHLSTYNRFDREARRVHFPLPWDNFRNNVEEKVNRILVSHKIKNAVKGQLHKESFYGLVKDRWGNAETDASDQALYSIKKPVRNLTESEVKKIADNSVREAVIAWRALPKDNRSEFPALPSGAPIKRVKIHDVHTNVLELRPGVFVEPGSDKGRLQSMRF